MPPTEQLNSPNRKHLTRLDRVWVNEPVYLVTICTRGRRPRLIGNGMPALLVDCLRQAAGACGWLVGRYVIMPDHVHLFCCPHADAYDLSSFVGRVKSLSTRAAWGLGVWGALWQREFHDHMLRSSESYAEKCDYVCMNPVRAGLCEAPDQWPHAGEVHQI